MAGTKCEEGAQLSSYSIEDAVITPVACIGCGAVILHRNFLYCETCGRKEGPYCDECIGIELVMTGGGSEESQAN